MSSISHRCLCSSTGTTELQFTLLSGKWVVLDVENPPRFQQVWVEGVLEFEVATKPNSTNPYNFVFSASHIIVLGRLIVGWPDNPLRGSAQLELWGDHSTEEVVLRGGAVVGAKAIGKTNDAPSSSAHCVHILCS